MNKPHEAVSFNVQQIRDLRKLVAQGESLTLEFKRKASFPEKIVREMIALANTRGGVLLIGVDDDGKIPGLKYPDEESHVIRQALKKCKPALQYSELYIPVGNARTVLQYDIRESKNKPHQLTIDSQTAETYVRVNDQSIKASREMIEIVRRSNQKRDIQFRYGEYEKMLMIYLDNNPTITLAQFMQLTKLKRFYASRKLVLLVLADVLRITPHEKGDLFSLAFRA
jgi:predicted HTH transcriptional regulator